MRHTAISATVIGLTVLTAPFAANAQTTVRVPRVVTTAPKKNATFAYVATPAMRERTRAEYLAKVGSKNPARAKMLAADFARINPDAFYRSLLKNTGLVDFDAADALAAYNLAGWIIANNVKTLPTRAQIQGARSQAATSLAKNPDMANPANWAKVGETFKLTTVTLHYGLLSARKSGDTKAYSDSIAQLFAETGPNPRNLVLTNTGFFVKK